MFKTNLKFGVFHSIPFGCILTFLLLCLIITSCSKQKDYQKRLMELEKFKKEFPYNRPWDDLTPFLQNEKWGFKNQDGKVIIPPIYQDIKLPKSKSSFYHYLIVKKEGKWGVITTSGKQAIPFQYNDLEFNYQNYYALRNTKFSAKVKFKWGLLNEAGEFNIPPQYDSIGEFSYERYPIKIKLNQKFGYLDRKNGKLITPFYDSIWYENENQTKIKIFSKGKYGYYDLQSKTECIPPIYDAIGMEYKHMKVRLGDRVGLIDWNGKILIPIQYENLMQLYHYNESFLSLVQLNEKWGIADSTGKEIFPIRYDSIFYTNTRYSSAKVRLNKCWGFVDKSGAELIPIIYDEISSNYLNKLNLVKKKNKYGIISSDGKIILPTKYDDIQYYSDNGELIPSQLPTKVKSYDMWAYIDKNGNEVTPFKYDEIPYTYGNTLPVRVGAKWGFINKSGQEITPIQYGEWRRFQAYQFVCSKNGKWKIIDTTGKEVNAIPYDSIHVYNDYNYGIILFKRKNQWELLDEKNKPKAILKKLYEDIRPSNSGIIAILEDGKWGFVNAAGTLIVPPKYDEITPNWDNKKIGVCLDEKWGIINDKGKLTTPIKNDYDVLYYSEEF
jgi:hypothetical protein